MAIKGLINFIIKAYEVGGVLVDFLLTNLQIRQKVQSLKLFSLLLVMLCLPADLVD